MVYASSFTAYPPVNLYATKTHKTTSFGTTATTEVKVIGDKTSPTRITTLKPFFSETDLCTLQTFVTQNRKNSSLIGRLDEPNLNLSVSGGYIPFDPKKAFISEEKHLTDEKVKNLLDPTVKKAYQALLTHYPELSNELQNKDLEVSCFLNCKPLHLNLSNPVIHTHPDYGIAAAIVPIELPEEHTGNRFYVQDRDSDQSPSNRNEVQPALNQMILMNDLGTEHGVTNIKPTKGKVLSTQDAVGINVGRTPRTVMVILFREKTKW